MNMDPNPLANWRTAALQRRYYVVSTETSRCLRVYRTVVFPTPDEPRNKLQAVSSVSTSVRPIFDQIRLVTTVVAICKASYPPMVCAHFVSLIGTALLIEGASMHVSSCSTTLRLNRLVACSQPRAQQMGWLARHNWQAEGRHQGWSTGAAGSPGSQRIRCWPAC